MIFWGPRPMKDQNIWGLFFLLTTLPVPSILVTRSKVQGWNFTLLFPKFVKSLGSSIKMGSKHCRLHVHQLVWSLVESVLKMDSKILNCFTFKNFVFCWLSRGRPPENCMVHLKLFKKTLIVFDWGWVGINFVGIWLWITMPPRCELSFLDPGWSLAWLNDGVWNCC